MKHTIYKITYLQMAEGYKKAGKSYIGTGEYDIKGIRTSYCYGSKGLDTEYGAEFWNDIGWWYEDWMENEFTKYNVKVLERFETQEEAFDELKRQYLRIGAITEDDIDAEGRVKAIITSHFANIKYDMSIYFGINIPKALEPEEVDLATQARAFHKAKGTVHPHAGLGKNNSDKRIHQFFNERLDKFFTGTVIDFKDKYGETGIKPSGISKLISLDRKKHKGWVYKGLGS